MSDDRPVIFAARNGHSAQCGQPPVVEAGPGRYASYFENQYGEQWIFVRREDAETATIYGGDIGWEEPQTMSGPPEKRENDWTTAGLVLNMPEALWLTACWAASRPRGK